MKNAILLLTFYVIFAISLSAQKRYDIQIISSQPPLLEANAGVDVTWNFDTPVLGGSPAAFGGSAPYNYQWSPSFNLNNAAIANPTFTGSDNTVYVLRVSDSRGCSSRDTVIITISDIDSPLGQAEFSVYPNPGSGIIKMSEPKEFNLEMTNIKLVDALGRIVIDTHWDLEFDVNSLDISLFDVGTYMLILSDGDLTLTRKLVIQ
ncbi:MAG: T9SS type A sorting domain-containing protein [Bacteroidia bacterium]